jgi:hypothetical protein
VVRTAGTLVHLSVNADSGKVTPAPRREWD